MTYDKEKQKAYYQKNKAEIAKKQKEYYQKNKAKILANAKIYREKHKAEIATRQKTNYQAQNNNEEGSERGIGLIDMGIVVETEPGYFALNPDLELILMHNLTGPKKVRVLANVDDKTYVINDAAALVINCLAHGEEETSQ